MEVLNLEQGSPEWFEARSGIPTVSQFSRFVTPARGSYSAQARGYVADLIVETVEGPSEGMSSYYMERGIVLEEEARDWYAFDHDCMVQECGLILNDGVGWSPDGIPDDAWKGGIEIKCPKPATHVKWLLEGALPDEHKPQCHGALIVGELEWLDFISYCPGYRPLLIRVTPDEYTEKVTTCLTRFLAEYEDAKKLILT